MEYMLEVPKGNRWYAEKYRTPEVGAQELEKRFYYIEWLKEKLGDNLVGVLLYGSAARTEDPKAHSDFDNWVRVRDVQAAQRLLQNTCPVVYEGKVISCTGEKHPEGSHHLGIHLFPESEDYLLRFIRFLHDSREFLLHTKVLHGEFPFINVRQDEVIERGISQAYIKLKTLAGAANWAYTFPEKLIDKQALFEFVVKNVRFFWQHALNALEGPKLRTKQDLTERLQERGIFIPEFKSDAGYIRQSVVQALHDVLVLQEEFYASGHRPNLDFLKEKREYTWDDALIDDWVTPIPEENKKEIKDWKPESEKQN